MQGQAKNMIYQLSLFLSHQSLSNHVGPIFIISISIFGSAFQKHQYFFHGHFISNWCFNCIIDYWIQIAFMQFSKDLFGSFPCIVLRRTCNEKKWGSKIFYVTLMIDIIMRNISDEIQGMNKFGHIQCSNKTFLAVV